MDKREVLILSFSHPQGVVENFVNQIALAFGCQNFDIKHLVLGHELQPQFSKINPSKIDMVFSIGPLPLSLNINDRPIFEFFRCPIVMYCIDNVIYDLARHPVCKDIFNLAKKEGRIKIVLSSNDYMENLCLTDKSEDSASKPTFMSMAGFFDHETFEKSNKVKRLCVIGSPGTQSVENVSLLDDIMKTAEANNFLSLSKNELSDIIDACNLTDFSGNVVQVILRRLRASNLDLLDDKLLKFSASIDSFIRVRTRLSAMRSLIGMPVDFYGSGWEKAFPEESGFEFKGIISHFDIPKIAQKYNALINFDPNLENGVHDRVFTALGVGTKVITNKNKYLETIPGHEKVVKTFSINNSDLRPLAETIFEEQEEYLERKALFQQHCWPSRIRDLLDAFAGEKVK